MATREEMRELAEVYQAIADGEDIQFTVINEKENWRDVPSDEEYFFPERCIYRIKPTPKEIFVDEDNNVLTGYEVLVRACSEEGITFRRFREVPYE